VQASRLACTEQATDEGSRTAAVDLCIDRYLFTSKIDKI
jgi:hypothetical protein